MPPRKAFPLRIDPAVHQALERWAADELRSVNGQIEFLLRQSLAQAGRLGKGGKTGRRKGGPKTPGEA